MSPLVSGEILGFSVNTLTSDGEYPAQGCENLQLSIQMQSSEKRKTFSEFFVIFLKSTSNFKHFEKKMIVMPNAFRKLHSVKIFLRKLSHEHRFKPGFWSQYVKASQRLP